MGCTETMHILKLTSYLYVIFVFFSLFPFLLINPYPVIFKPYAMITLLPDYGNVP